ncbi:MAG: hypothetical protein ACLFRB_04390 [Thiohalorhabdus sp.]|uniref:hypothetical protein n=1 Tax=Thiohalorhabdus sp. TaxID=3094134 RepID=UPI00397F70FD
MSLATGSIQKNGKVLVDHVRVWVNAEEDGSGHRTYWGYLNPEWETPIGRLDPDGEPDPRYELDLEGGEHIPIRLEDHRDEAFIQVNQNGYRTLHFRSVQ